MFFSVIMAVAMAYMVANAAFGHGRAQSNWKIIKTYRPMHFVINFPVILVVVAVATLLIDYVPFFDKNPFLWLFSTTFGLGNGEGTSNVVFAGLEWEFYAALFLPLLIFAVPHLAKIEEEVFRLGTRDWKQGIVRSVVFGLIHLIMMIPLGAAVALTIGGMWFTHHYFKGGIQRSTTHHAVYNTMLISLIFVSIFIFS